MIKRPIITNTEGINPIHNLIVNCAE